MRLIELQLIAFGHFTDVHIPFSPKPGTVHIIVGRNEAGKTTALRAIRALLYGFPERSRDNFLHAKPLVGGQLARSTEDAASMTTAFVRRKGRKNTLLTPEQEPLEADALEPFLQGVTETQFAQHYGLDHVALRAGGQRMLEGKGHLGQALFNASLGGQTIQRTLTRLEEHAEGLFRPKGKQFPLNQAIRSFQEAQRRVRSEALRRSAYQAQQVALEEAQRALEAVGHQLENVSHQLEETRRDLSLLPLIQRALRLAKEREGLAKERQGLAKERDGVAEEQEVVGKVVRPTSQEEVEQTKKAEAAIERANQHLRAHRQELERLAEKLANLAPDTGVAELPSELVREIENRKGSLIAREAELSELRLRRKALEDEISGALTALQLVEARTWPSLRLPAGAAARIHVLAQQYGALEAALSAAEDEERELRRRLVDVERARHELPKGRSVNALTAALEASHSLLLRMQQQRHGMPEIRELEAEASQHIAGLHPATPKRFDGPTVMSLDGLSPLPIPDEPTVVRWERSIADANAALIQTRDELEEARTTLQELEQERKVLARGGPIPREEHLLEARKEREQLWGVIRRALERPNPSEHASSAQQPLGVETPNPVRFEQSVARVDHLADQLRNEAQRVTQDQALEEQLQRKRARIKALDAAEAQQQAAVDELADGWQRLWKAADLSPLPPPEMRAWLRRYEALTRTLQKLAYSRELLQQQERETESCRSALRRALPDDDPLLAADNDPFAVWVSQARARLEEERACENRIHETERELETVRSRLRTVEEVKTSRASELAAWRAAWKDAMKPLGLSAGALPEEAVAVLDAFAAVVAKGDQLTAIDVQIASIDADRARLRELLFPLLDRISFPVPAGTLAEVAETFVRAHHRVVRDQELREELVRDQDSKTQALRREEAERDEHQQYLAGLMDAAQVTTVAELKAQQEWALRIRALEEEHDAVRREIEESAEGASFEALLERLCHTDPATLRVSRESLQQQRKQLQEERANLQTRLGRLEAGLENQQNRSEAASAASDAEAALASVKDLAHRFVRLRVAGSVLRKEIERYQRENEGPLLARANALFPKLTLGRYSRLQVGFADDDEPILQCIRRDGRGVRVDQLSDGTQDQLYLALRLASLERQAETLGPMPLILDDVLIHFDDERARAALGALGVFAKGAQVLFFTHQSRLVELAQEVIPRGQLDLHDLDALRGGVPVSREGETPSHDFPMADQVHPS